MTPQEILEYLIKEAIEHGRLMACNRDLLTAIEEAKRGLVSFKKEVETHDAKDKINAQQIANLAKEIHDLRNWQQQAIVLLNDLTDLVSRKRTREQISSLEVVAAKAREFIEEWIPF